MERQKKKRSYDKLHFPRKAATSTSTILIFWLRSTCLCRLVYTYVPIYETTIMSKRIPIFFLR